MNVKSLISVAALSVLLVGGSAIAAQEGGKRGHCHGHKGHKFARAMFAKLNLTDTQKQQIKAIREEMRPAFQALRADESLNREQKKEKAMALREEMRTKVMAILSPEQRAQLEKLRAERQSRKDARIKV